MAARYHLLACLILCAVLCCGDNPTGPAGEQFSRDQLVGVWKGNLSRWVIVKDTSQLSGVTAMLLARQGYVNHFDFRQSLVLFTMLHCCPVKI